MNILLSLFRRVKQYSAVRADPVEWARGIGVEVGEACRFLGVGPQTFGSEPFLVSLGDHVTVTSGVRFVTHDGGVWVFREEFPDIDVFGRIDVGRNVFIGLGAIILPGVTIGENSIIGAGSVVTKDIPSGTVAAGVPAKPIRSVKEYRERIRKAETHIRSLPYDEKRREITQRLGVSNQVKRRLP